MRWHAIRITEQYVAHVVSELTLHELADKLVRPVRRRRTHRGLHIETPLIAGYLFAGFDQTPPWAIIRRIKGVRGPLAMTREGLPSVVSEHDIARLHVIEMLAKLEVEAEAAAESKRRILARQQRRRRPRPSKRLRADDEAQALRESLDAMPLADVGTITAVAA